MWLIDNWSWANGEFLRSSGTSLLNLDTRDLVDAAFRLLIVWGTARNTPGDHTDHYSTFFRDKETEWETGMPVLPGWAALGDVSSQFGVPDDGADPFGASEPTSE
jgi:hypothetical protein